MAVQHDFSYSRTWDLILIIVGSLVQAIGFKGIVAPGPDGGD